MLTTDDIMRGALELSGLTEIPGDCGIYVPGSDIKKILFGVDIGAAELMLARDLGCDLALAHHPNPGTIGYKDVLMTHVRWMTEAGVPGDEAQAAIAGLLERVTMNYHRGNWGHVTSVATLLGIPFMNVHSPLDLIGRKTMMDAIAAVPAGATVADVVAALETLPEYRAVPTAIEVLHGSPSNPAGRVAVVHGAGTNGGYSVARAYLEHGHSTVVYIHIEQSELHRLREYGKGNLIVCGHIAGDLLGMNVFRRWLEERGAEVIPFSGLEAAP